MHKSDYEHLKFRRGYLITSLKIECPFVHKAEQIDQDFTLYYHPDLTFTKAGNGTQNLFLLGDLYDYEDYKATNQDILNKLVLFTFDNLICETFRYAGRFVIVYSGPEGVKLFHDAASLRKIFYTYGDSGLSSSCASNPHLLAEALGAARTSNPCWQEFYKSAEFVGLFNGNIGYYTLYDEIRQVLPNHYLDLNHQKAIRYWPKDKPEKIDDRKIVGICARMIKGFLAAAAHRHHLMIPVTSGYDSRIIYAATKDLSEDIFFYINYYDKLVGKPDFWVPKKMLEINNRKFNIIKSDTPIADEFKKIYYRNNPVPHDFYLPVIYNYYLNFSDRTNLPGGFIPLIKSLYASDSQEITGKTLAGLYKVDRFPCAVGFYEDWLKNSKDVCDNLIINIFDLLYWEDRTCNWGTQVSQDKDIAQEELLIFNSHELMTTMLNYSRSKRKAPKYGLHKEIIKELWPELLKFPFNPSFRSNVKNLLIKLGLYEPFIKIKKILKKN